MTFLEAAIEVLRQHGRPLSVRELTERAIRSNLLSHLGRAPEETMQTRLAQEVKKGDRSPFIQKGNGVFGLRRYDLPAPAKAAPAARADRKSQAVAPVKPAEEPAEGGDEAKKKRRRRGGRGRKKGAGAQESPAPEAGTPEEAIVAEQLAAEAAEVDADVPAPEPAAQDLAAGAALDAMAPVTPRRYPRIVDLPDDAVLSEQYADEVAAGGVAPPTSNEVIDAQSADEDRPMLAEIKEERDRRRRRDRKEDRKKDKRDKKRAPGEAREAPAAAKPQPKPPHAPPPPPRPMPPPVVISTAVVSPAIASPSPATAMTEVEPQKGGGEIVEVALAMLRSLNDPRPVHARQLAAMALKRKLLAGDPEEVWRAIRSAIAGDARLRQALGLRIRARHQGGGLITLTTARLEPEVRAAEEAIETRWQELSRVTITALTARAARLPLAALEQLARIYLDHAGIRDVMRVKRHNETWYLAGTQRRGLRAVKLLISVRAGAQDGGRDAVGELRAGVIAKGVDEGLLLAPARLGAAGVAELDAQGPTVVAFTGDVFAEELIARGVGVVRANLPLAYLDVDLLAELSEA